MARHALEIRTTAIESSIFTHMTLLAANMIYNTNKTKSSQGLLEISLRKRNLLKATPELGQKLGQQIGMKIEAILNPKCKCGDLIYLDSSVYPTYSGYYQIDILTLKGGTKEADWKMAIDSKNNADTFKENSTASSNTNK